MSTSPSWARSARAEGARTFEKMMKVNLMSHFWARPRRSPPGCVTATIGAIVNVSSVPRRSAFNMWALRRGQGRHRRADPLRAVDPRPGRHSRQRGRAGRHPHAAGQPGASAKARTRRSPSGRCRSSTRSSASASPRRSPPRRPGCCRTNSSFVTGQSLRGRRRAHLALLSLDPDAGLLARYAEARA